MSIWFRRKGGRSLRNKKHEFWITFNSKSFSFYEPFFLQGPSLWSGRKNVTRWKEKGSEVATDSVSLHSNSNSSSSFYLCSISWWNKPFYVIHIAYKSSGNRNGSSSAHTFFPSIPYSSMVSSQRRRTEEEEQQRRRRLQMSPMNKKRNGRRPISQTLRALSHQFGVYRRTRPDMELFGLTGSECVIATRRFHLLSFWWRLAQHTDARTEKELKKWVREAQEVKLPRIVLFVNLNPTAI